MGEMRVVAEGMFRVRWAGTREPSDEAPDPAFPAGSVASLAGEAPECCAGSLRYPAPGVGVHRVECLICGASGPVAARGLASDPRRVLVACKRMAKA